MEMYQQSIVNLKEASNAIKEMQTRFSDGGIISFSDMEEFELFKLYPTGKNCMAYRIPAEEGRLNFIGIMSPIDGEDAKYGFHAHDDCDETCYQVTGTAHTRGNKKPPGSKTTFPAGEWHDYIMKESGVMYVTFKKINNPSGRDFPE